MLNLAIAVFAGASLFGGACSRGPPDLGGTVPPIFRRMAAGVRTRFSKDQLDELLDGVRFQIAAVPMDDRMALIRRMIEADYEALRVWTWDGWIVSRTEGALASLYVGDANEGG